ncbi:hypothetical protein TNIN_414831 [Trichonephila inaurata madagascariensis]|uniref:Uncharacterized protein n=1 Tax=Trichonephila inaurata madagascariensis TaxID=2747483 RepID=A0A8X6WRV0_9ARAC|nr:hypothetical protein TNIN_414831 [Trichonephila inaurata madagascariensis]
MAKGKVLERKFSDIERQISRFITFVDTFDEDEKEVLTIKLSQLEILNIKFEEEKEIFTSLTDAEFDKFDAKITTCNEHIQKLEERQQFESFQPDTRRQDDGVEEICFQNSGITNKQTKTDGNSFNFPSAQNNIVQGHVSGVNMNVSASQKHKNAIILSTCVIYVENSVGEKFPYAFSQTAGRKLRSSAANFSNLRKLKTDMSVCGLGGSNVNIKPKVKGVISNGSGSYTRVVDFHVVTKITNDTC